MHRLNRLRHTARLRRLPALGAPHVLFDFLFERGLLSVAVENTGKRAAFDVRFDFSRPFRGLGGSLEFTSLRLFAGIPSLPVGKRIEAFLDESHCYFERREPTEIVVRAFYRDEDGSSHTSTWYHDLAIYRDLPYRVANAASEVTSTPEPTRKRP